MEQLSDFRTPNSWRLIDTGHLTAAENIAWDKAFLTAQAENEDEIPVLRFLQFKPAAVLVGRHQVVEQEARISFIKQQGYDINRRLTGGGAIFFDPSQIGWEVFARYGVPGIPGRMDEIYRVFCNALAAGLKKLGINAYFRPRNDIEVDGRKISGTGGASESGAFFFQGTLLVEDKSEEMLRSLRVPAEKLGRHGLESIRERVAFAATLLGHTPQSDELKAAIADGFRENLGIYLTKSEPTEREISLYNEFLPYYRSEEWVYMVSAPRAEQGVLTGLSVGDGGTVRAAVMVNAKERRVRAVQFYGDFFAAPSRFVADMEARLKHIPAKQKRLRNEVSAFFMENKPYLLGLTEDNFAEALVAAVEKIHFVRQGFSFEDANRIAFIGIDPANWNEHPFDRFLFPYCSKLVGCSYRHSYECPICGGCTVGDGYEIALSAGLEPYTITSFEHLMETLNRYKEDGVQGYIGSCCQEFYAKHQRDFEQSGVPGMLLFIDSTTCYDLSQAKAAYRGDFESQTEVDTDMIRRVLALIRSNKVSFT